MNRKSEVILIIPSYNEADNIERVVDELRLDYPQFDYVVVTDGPTDGTDEICRRRGFNAVFLPENIGLTGCFRSGMKYAWEQGYSYAVQFDGDGQHRPEYIVSMVEEAKKGFDLVQGSRFLPLKQTERKADDAAPSAGPGDAKSSGISDCSEKETVSEPPMKGMRSLGSRIIRMAILFKTGRKVTDPTCGLRLYSRKLIDDFANKSSYAPEPDTVAKLLKKGVTYAEVPVRVSQRTSGESYLKPGKAAEYMWRMVSSILRK